MALVFVFSGVVKLRQAAHTWKLVESTNLHTMWLGFWLMAYGPSFYVTAVTIPVAWLSHTFQRAITLRINMIGELKHWAASWCHEWVMTTCL